LHLCSSEPPTLPPYTTLFRSHATRERLAGSYNAAADGVLAFSEVASLLGKPLLPVLPPWGTVLAADQLRRLGLRIPVELLRALRDRKSTRLNSSHQIISYAVF